MRKAEVWAIDENRISAFFREQPNSSPAESGFSFGDCRVTVTALEPRRMAGMALPQTLITFEGEEASVISVYQRFLLRFLSAGG